LNNIIKLIDIEKKEIFNIDTPIEILEKKKLFNVIDIIYALHSKEKN